jgi:hypothetical protein
LRSRKLLRLSLQLNLRRKKRRHRKRLPPLLLLLSRKSLQRPQSHSNRFVV